MTIHVNVAMRALVLVGGIGSGVAQAQAVSAPAVEKQAAPIEVVVPASPAPMNAPAPPSVPKPQADKKSPRKLSPAEMERLMNALGAPKVTAWTVVQVPQGKVQAMRLTTVGGGLFHRTTGALGMKPGDVIFAVDGAPVRSTADFDSVFGKKTNLRSMIRVDFVRDGVVHQVIGPVDVSTMTMWKVAPKWGGEYEEATVEFGPELLQKPIVRTVNALEIASVKNESAAAKAGMQAKDVMVLLNGHGIGQLKVGDTIVPLVPEGTPVKFTWLRDGVRMEGVGEVTKVRQGLAKTLQFGFSGSTRMVDVPGEEMAVAAVGSQAAPTVSE